MNLPDLAVRRPVASSMVYLALAALSVVALTRLSVDMLPEVDYPAMTISTSYEGADPEEVETKITRPIEGAVAIVPGLKEIRSESREGGSTIRLLFEWGTDLDSAANDVRDRIGIIRTFLPEDATEPRILKFNISQFPILFIGVKAPKTHRDLYTLLDNQVVDRIKRAPGVGNVWIQGARIRQIHVKVNRRKMEARGITLRQIEEALKANNLTQPAGDLTVGSERYVLRVPGEFSSVEEIGRVPVAPSVYIADIAEVEDGFTDPDDRSRIDGVPGATVVVQKRSGANTVRVCEAVKEMLPALLPLLPPDVEFTILRDASLEIRRTLANLRSAVLTGGALVALITVLFLRSGRASAVVLVAIPFSLLLSFFFLWGMGYTLNIVSLASLAVAIGMVVDNSIVVLENIQRRREELGEPFPEAAIRGTSEVGLAISASTLTTIAIFLPLVFSTGITGVMFKQLAYIVTITLLASLFIAMTLSPVLARYLLAKDRPGRGRIFPGLQAGYQRLLAWALDHRKIVLTVSAAALAAAGWMFAAVPKDFFPEGDEGMVQATLEMPVGTDVTETDRAMARLEKAVEEVLPERIAMQAIAGRPPGLVRAFQPIDLHRGRLLVRLPPVEKRSRHLREINAELRERVSRIPGVRRANFSSGGVGAFLLRGRQEKPIAVEISGHNLEDSHRIAREVQAALSEFPEIADISITREIGVPEYRVVLDRRKIAALGLPVREVARTIETAFAGRTATVYREGGDEFDVRVRLAEEDRRDIRDVMAVELETARGRVRLSNVAEVRRGLGPVSIERKDQQRVVEVLANTTTEDLAGLARRLSERLARIPLPAGLSLELGGNIRQQREAFSDLRLAFLLGVMLTYMVMAAQFESLRQPFLVMFTVPFGVAGAVFALFASGLSLNVGSFLGVIMLVGIVVNNAIVLVDFANRLQGEGRPAREAVLEAGRVRLRPILMTTLTTVGGMLPMAVSRAQGSETWAPLATVVIGGLLVSTFAALFLIPVLYSSFATRSASPR